MIKIFLDDIKKAKENKAYLSAFALALTIPDICGKEEFYKTGNMSSRDKYIAWFDEWVLKYLAIPKGDNKQFNEYDDMVTFDGDACYALRCAFLHEGKKIDYYHNKDKGIRIDRFELCICTGEFQYGESNGASFSYGELKETSRRINLIKLIEYIVMGAEKFLEQYNNDNNKYGTIKIIKF